MMFASDPTRDPASNRLTRRLFLTGGTLVCASFVGLQIFRAPGVEASTAVHGTPGLVTIVNFSNDGRNLGSETVPKIVKTDGEWYRQLGRNTFDIARDADTETPYYGKLLNEHRPGVFRCACCDTALFNAKTKFDSNTGWPSFWAPIAKENVAEFEDRSMGMRRTEVRCSRCEAHLGHVFNDGPEPTGLRYCMNSASLSFRGA